MTATARASVWTGVGYDIPAEDTVDLLARHGFRHAELGHLHGLQLFESGRAAAFRKHADDAGMSFPQGHVMLGIDISDPDDAVRRPLIDRLRNWMDMYAELDIGLCVLHPGRGTDRYAGADPGAVRAARTEVLSRLMEHTRDMPVTICLENLPDVGTDADELLEMIGLTGMDNAGICLDTGHLNLAGGDPAAFIRRCGSRLLALHLNDNTGPHNPDRSVNSWWHDDDLHLLPVNCEGGSKGFLRWREIADALRENGYAGLFNFEILGEFWGTPLPLREIKLDHAKRLARWLFDAS